MSNFGKTDMLLMSDGCRRIFTLFLCLLAAIVFRPVFAQSSTAEDDLLLTLPAILGAARANNSSDSPVINPNPPTENGSLCRGFSVNDKRNRPMQPMVRPAPGASYTDRVFGSKVTRISNSSAIESGIIRTLYSTIQSWNADESLMILWHRGQGHYLYNGQTYQVVRRLNVAPADIEQLFWSTTNPDLFYYPNIAVGQSVPTVQGSYRLKGKELMSYNVRTRNYELIKDFDTVCTDGDGVTGGNDVQMVSYDDDAFGFRCGTKGFGYHRSTDTVMLLPSSSGFTAPQSFPSGDNYYHQGRILNRQLATQRRLDLGNVAEHASLGRLHNGNDAYFAIAFAGNQNNSCGNGIGSVVVHDVTDASCRVLVGPSNGYPYSLSGTHISALAHQRPGWAAVSSVGYGDEGDTVLEQELYLANTDPAKLEVCRIAHHRSSGRLGSIGYFAEPHPVLSPSGTRVLFNSDWNNSGSVDVYVLELEGF